VLIGEKKMKFLGNRTRRSALVALLCTASLPPVSIAIAAKATAADKFRFGLNWKPQMEMCGFFQAREAGLYRNANLDVELVHGGPSLNNAQLVAARSYDAAMGTALTSLNMRNSGVPGTTVAAMFQKSPITMVAHPGAGVSKLEDMAGRPVAIPATGRPIQWAWLKGKFGFDDSQLRPFSFDPATFVVDKNAIRQGYATEDGYLFGKALGEEPVSLLLADRGYPDYATTIFTSDATVAERRDVLGRFVAASRDGFAQCITGDPSLAISAIAAESADQPPDLSKFKLTQMKRQKLVDSGDAASSGIGTMSDARWASIFAVMSEIGLYPKDMRFQSAYTLDFVPTKSK
jgi:NitT/TauT family transport system substrate-binding protein